MFPFPVVIEVKSRLGSVLLRLEDALSAAEAEGQVSKTFKADLVAAVPRLRRYALARSQNAAEADDLVQTTLMRAWENRSGFVPGTNLIAWLFTILRNTFINQRKRLRREVEDIDGAFAATLSLEPEQEHRVGLIELQAALNSLTAEHRETLLLVMVDGLLYEEAAAVLGCQPGTVKSRVSRARERLALAMGAA
ncbi:sigma-70 family RNA polymerase sigma factor [Methylobacterium sp. BTF04]|uniref:sigma-70 family RNA polymerase sigma factor n=1 Tax=Methylobacterium sp. BTF04 TaxID=2708300 RepID=UPI001FED7283|nr:sigma-70 family RNA polymerase sigma factor [Methylobacterium sp. BTF04]